MGDVVHLPSVHEVDPPPRIAVSFVRPLAHGLARLGVAPAEFLAALGLPPDAREGRIPIADLARAVDDLAARLAMPHIALELVRMIPLGVLGTSDYCFSTSATLLDGLKRIASHQSMFTEATTFQLHIDGDVARIEQGHHFKPLGILTELATAFAVRRLRDVLGEAAVTLGGVRFMHGARAPIAPYAQFFGAPVEFEAAADDFSFPRELLMAPLLTADGALAQLLAEHRPPPREDAPDPLVAQAKGAVAALLGDGALGVGVDQVAARLALSSRTLQRRLGERGTSFSELLDEVRRELAETLLANEGVLLATVSYRLGFQDMTAFFRAFRRWTGMSPRQFQRARTPRA